MQKCLKSFLIACVIFIFDIYYFFNCFFYHFDIQYFHTSLASVIKFFIVGLLIYILLEKKKKKKKKNEKKKKQINLNYTKRVIQTTKYFL